MQNHQTYQPGPGKCSIPILINQTTISLKRFPYLSSRTIWYYLFYPASCQPTKISSCSSQVSTCFFTQNFIKYYLRLLNNKTLNKDKLATGAARSSLRFCIKNLHTLFLVCFFKVKGVVFFMQKPCIALTAIAKLWLKVLSMVNFFYAQ